MPRVSDSLPSTPTSPFDASSDRRVTLPDHGRVSQPSPGAIESTTLLNGGKSVTISHNGTAYRLQATRQGKLILTK